MAMAYDAARGLAVLFGGFGNGRYLGDTWTWDGTDWIPGTPAHAPAARYLPGGAYLAGGGRVVLFGGSSEIGLALGDTWDWDGTDWVIPFPASIRLTPSSGPPGTVVQITGRSFGAVEKVTLIYFDSTTGATELAADETGAFSIQITIPSGATPGQQKVGATGSGSGQIAAGTFIIT
jgi:hypothetical protein